MAEIIKLMNYSLISEYSIEHIQKVLESYGLKVIHSSNTVNEYLTVHANEKLLFRIILLRSALPTVGGVMRSGRSKESKRKKKK